MKKRNNLFIGLTSATAILAAPFIMSACQTSHSQLRQENTMMSEGNAVGEKKCDCAKEGKECDCKAKRGEQGTDEDKEECPGADSCGG